MTLIKLRFSFVNIEWWLLWMSIGQWSCLIIDFKMAAIVCYDLTEDIENFRLKEKPRIIIKYSYRGKMLAGGKWSIVYSTIHPISLVVYVRIRNQQSTNIDISTSIEISDNIDISISNGIKKILTTPPILTEVPILTSTRAEVPQFHWNWMYPIVHKGLLTPLKRSKKAAWSAIGALMCFLFPLSHFWTFVTADI